MSVLPMEISAEANVASQRWMEEVGHKEKLHSSAYSSNGYFQQIIYSIVRETKRKTRDIFNKYRVA
jgi:hypothetical protein